MKVLLLMMFVFLAVSASDKPNFLFIFTDDQTYDSIQSLGNKEIMTPNIDRLVNEGTVFTHAYNMGSWSGAVCIASRTMLNTGRFVWRAQNLKLEDELKSGHLWANYLKNAGYTTYMSGKWHLNVKPDLVFENCVNPRPGMPNQTKEGYNRPLGENDEAWTPWDTKFGGFWKGGKHWSEVLAEDTINFLKKAKDDPKPFFMYIAFNAPHDPRQSPKEFVDKYPIDKISVPTSFLAEYPDKNAIGCSEKLRDEALAPFPRTEYAVKVHRQEYYASITYLDEQLGKILDELEKTGKKNNTYIFFTADHGLAIGDHGLMGKQNMYDHSLRVPFIMVGPKVNKNVKNDVPIYLQDVMPTTLELAGIPKPKEVDFNSVMPLLDGKAKEHYPTIYGCYLDLQRAIVKDNFKLIYYPKIDTYKLFDLKADPNEMKNLASEIDFAGKLNEMQIALQKLMLEMDDKLKLEIK